MGLVPASSGHPLSSLISWVYSNTLPTTSVSTAHPLTCLRSPSAYSGPTQRIKDNLSACDYLLQSLQLTTAMLY